MLQMNNRYIIPHKQKSQLTKYTHCKLDYLPCDIKSLIFWFDSFNDVIPKTFVIREDGKQVTNTEDIKIVKIVDNRDVDQTYDSDGNYLLFYDNDYVRRNYRHYIKAHQSLKELVGSFIIDWGSNIIIISKLKELNSQFIEMNYYIYNPNVE